MGIDYEVVIFYGIVFTYDELKDIKDNILLEIGYLIGCSFPNELTNIWTEFGEPIISPYYDADSTDCLYGIGKQFYNDNFEWCRAYGFNTTIEKMNDFIKECDRENINDKIKKFCNKNNLEYKTPSLIIMPTVS